MERTLATFIDFSTLAAARSRSSIFLVNDLICARPGKMTSQPGQSNMIKQTYLLFPAFILFDDTWVGVEKHLQSLSQCPQLVLQLVRGSLVRRTRLPSCETKTQLTSPASGRFDSDGPLPCL
jgi:hypothetical protein